MKMQCDKCGKTGGGVYSECFQCGRSLCSDCDKENPCSGCEPQEKE